MANQHFPDIFLCKNILLFNDVTYRFLPPVHENNLTSKIVQKTNKPFKALFLCNSVSWALKLKLLIEESLKNSEQKLNVKKNINISQVVFSLNISQNRGTALNAQFLNLTKQNFMWSLPKVSKFPEFGLSSKIYLSVLSKQQKNNL